MTAADDPGVTDLYPTKTRLALLAEVRADNVMDGITDDRAGDTWLFDGAPPFDPPRKVTARVLELEAAGWVQRDSSGVFWRLTDAGHAVWAAAYVATVDQ